MQITNIKTYQTTPAFTSRKRVVQDDNIKMYKGQKPSLHESFVQNAPFLLQRFDLCDSASGSVGVKDRTYDSFTGLRDKNYLLAALSVKMQEAQKNNSTLSIAMFDMDDFKSVNELLGYETGDIFIKEISKEISEIAKKNNINVYRFGGEEFVLIFDHQTDEQKKQIAQSITEKINANPTLQSYKNEYMKSAQERLDKSFYATAKMKRISELKMKKETLKELIENLTVPGAKEDPYLMDAMMEIHLQIESVYRNLINECLLQEQDERNIEMLKTVQSKLISGIRLFGSEKRELDEYLSYVYEKTGEIFQTKKWMSDFKQNDGFGITCGVVNLEPSSFKDKNPMFVIEKASKVLKKGKSSGKGQIYFYS